MRGTPRAQRFSPAVHVVLRLERNTSDGGEVGVSHARWIIYAVVGGLLLLWGLWWVMDGLGYLFGGRFTFVYTITRW